MSRIVGLLQTLRCHMSVDLCRGETGMTEQGLDASEIRPVVEKMGGEGMPEFVGAECRGETCLPDVVLQEQPDRAMA